MADKSISQTIKDVDNNLDDWIQAAKAMYPIPQIQDPRVPTDVSLPITKLIPQYTDEEWAYEQVIPRIMREIILKYRKRVASEAAAAAEDVPEDTVINRKVSIGEIG